MLPADACSSLRRFILLAVCTLMLAAAWVVWGVPNRTQAADAQHLAGMVQSGRILPSAVVTSAVSLYLPIVVGEPDTTCSALPLLLEPADGAQLDTLVPVFKWTFSGGPQATGLRLELSLTPEFTNPNTYSTFPSSGEWWFPSNRREDTTYYWRMMVYCNDTEGSYTAVRSFHTGSNGVIPAAPQLSEPANGATTGRTVTFRWQSVEGATQYILYYQQGGAGANFFEVVDGTSTTVELTSGSYEWWVRSRNSYAISPMPEHWQFTVK